MGDKFVQNVVKILLNYVVYGVFLSILNHGENYPEKRLVIDGARTHVLLVLDCFF